MPRRGGRRVLGTALAGGVAMTMLGAAATVPSMAATSSASEMAAATASVADKTALNSYISAMSIMNEGCSTFEAWNDLEAAYRNADSVSKNDSASQDEVDRAAKALNDALKVVSDQNLQMTHDADRTKLHQYISATSVVFPNDDTDPEYAQKYHDAAKRALEVDKDYSATKEEVDKAASDLNQAMVDIQRHHKSDGTDNGSGSGSGSNDASTGTNSNTGSDGSGDDGSRAVDKTQLESYMHSIYLWSEDKASFRSYNELQMAYRTAQQVDNDANATQEQVDKAAGDLNAKMKVIADNQIAGMNKTDRKSIHGYIKSTSVLIEGNYPADRWQDYLKMLDQAYEVDERPTATQDEIDGMAKKLNEAMFNLTIPGNTGSDANSNGNGNSNGGSASSGNSNANSNSNSNDNSGDSGTGESKYSISDLKDIKLTFGSKTVPGFRYDKTSYAITTHGSTADSLGIENLPDGWAQMPASSVNSSDRNVTNRSMTVMSPDGSFSITYSVIVTNVPKDSQDGNSNANGSDGNANAGNGNETDKDTVDKSKLESVMHSIYLWSPDKASFRSYNELQTAYRNAQQVDGNVNATQAQVDAAEKDLNAKMKVVADNELAGMGKTDRKKLHSYISATSYFFESNYTPETWKKAAEAIDKAYEVDENPSATQEDIDAAGKALNDALAGLVSKVASLNKAKTKLNVQLGSDGYLIESAYTSESWQRYKDALAKGHDVYENDDATQAEVDAAYRELTDAIRGLEKKAATDKSKLNIQLGSDGYLIRDNYTSSSWQKYADALKTGYEVLDDGEATQAQVDVAYKRLTGAINGLTYQDGYLKASSPEALTKALACASLLNVDTAGMDDATVSNLKAAISSAQDALDAGDPANTAQVASLLSFGATLDGDGDDDGATGSDGASAQPDAKASNDVNKAYENLLDKMSAASVEQASYVVDDGSIQLRQAADTIEKGNENASPAEAVAAALMQTGDPMAETAAAAGVAGIIGAVIAFCSRLIRRRR